MSQVLYRKYRSQNFDELIGQDHITRTLKSAVLTGKVSHAYLFVGSRGTGKTSTARILAKALNCTDLGSDGNPCLKCKSCLEISNGSFMDLIEIDAASNRGIDQIRELKERLEFSPVEGKYKIYIIDEVHMLTKEAFNALLKTLEEPPAHVIFMLATTDVHKLPATILSRCQRYDFKLATQADLREILKGIAKKEGINLDDKGVSLIIENAHGSFRDALSLLDIVVSAYNKEGDESEVSEDEVRQILGIPDTTMVYHLLEKVVTGDRVGAFDLISQLEEKGVNLQQFVGQILSVLRGVLVENIKGDGAEIFDFARGLTVSDISLLISRFLQAEKDLKGSSIPGLVLELAVSEISLGKTNKARLPKEEIAVEAAQESAEMISEEEEVSEEEDTEEEELEEEMISELDMDSIKSNWKKLVQKIKPIHNHLFAFLNGATPLEISGGVLMLEVPFEFHKDRIESAKSREAIMGVMKEVYGGVMKIECVVNSNSKKKREVSADIILKRAVSEEPRKETVMESSQKKVYTPKPDPRIDAIFADM